MDAHPHDLILAIDDTGPTVLAITAEFLPHADVSAASLRAALQPWMPHVVGSLSVGAAQDSDGLRLELTIGRVHDPVGREQLIAWLRSHPRLHHYQEYHPYGQATTGGQGGSAQAVEHRARVTWSPAHIAAGLPRQAELVDPAWLEGSEPPAADAWSLVCRFAPTPAEQGSPSSASIRFWLAEAPHQKLRPGAVLQLFERATGEHARVEVLE